MPGKNPGPLGTNSITPNIDHGTLARTPSPRPVTVGTVVAAGGDAVAAMAATGGAVAAAAAAVHSDPAIEALNLRGTAKNAAYELKKLHPSVKFTSGRRGKDDQARAMASNVVENRKWIEQTYVSTTVSKACQKWVDDNPDKKTKDSIAAGLLAVMDAHTDADLAKLSKHLSGDAFDVQPVETNADAIKKTIRGLTGLDEFLEKEGGLVRWHAQF
jgi:hypothetical protein